MKTCFNSPPTLVRKLACSRDTTLDSATSHHPTRCVTSEPAASIPPLNLAGKYTDKQTDQLVYGNNGERAGEQIIIDRNVTPETAVRKEKKKTF